MTMPDERTRATIDARRFLIRLLVRPNAGGFARVPKEVRAEAHRLLKHYPLPVDLLDPASFDKGTVQTHGEHRWHG